MSINVKAKQDYSFLFSGLSGSAGANMNFLSDYASIKNGSYGKLMKSYYSAEKASAAVSEERKSSSRNILEKFWEQRRNPKVSKDVQEANANLTAGLSTLKTSVAALRSDKTYTDTAGGQSAADKTVSAMKAYVEDYNSVVNASKGSTLTGKTAYVANMMSSTAANADKLSEVGITVEENGNLKLNEAKLREAGSEKVKELFSANNIMSYGSMIASRVQFAGITSGTSAAGSADAGKAPGASAASLKTAGQALASDALYASVKDKDGNDTGKYDVEKILATAKDFVNSYNGMFDAAQSSANSGVVSNLSYIREKTARSEDALKQFGISTDSKGKMQLDEETFKKSDMSKVQKVFKDYGSSIATSASLVDYYMTTQANAASGYTSAGTYNAQGSVRYAGTV